MTWNWPIPKKKVCLYDPFKVIEKVLRLRMVSFVLHPACNFTFPEKSVDALKSCIFYF